MDEWAETLAGRCGRLVIDKTGVTGNYDFALKYKGRWDRDRKADDDDPTAADGSGVVGGTWVEG